LLDTLNPTYMYHVKSGW